MQLPPLFFVHVGILSVVYGTLLIRPTLILRYRRHLVFAAVLIISGVLLVLAHKEFVGLIEAPPPARYYAPPFNSLSFFCISFWTRIAAPSIISLVTGVLLYGLLKSLRGYTDRFHPAEQEILALTILCLPQPLWMLFPAASGLFYVLMSITITIHHGKNTRTSLYPFWLPIGLTIILLSPFILKAPLAQLLSFTRLQ